LPAPAAGRTVIDVAVGVLTVDDQHELWAMSGRQA